MRRRLLAMAVALLTAGAVGVLWFSDVFDVRTVRVLGTHYTTPDGIRAAAGIRIGDRVARVDVDAATRRILDLPQVRSVQVRRGLPHDIVIDVQERVAIAYAGRGSGARLIDDAGVMFQDVVTPPPGLLAVRAYTDGFRGLGARVAASLPAWLRARVSAVTVYGNDDVRLQLRNGHVVRWGGEERAERKGRVLEALLRIPAREYDVSAPDAPATTR